MARLGFLFIAAVPVSILLVLVVAVPEVIIVTDPPTPPYPAATWIRFRCDVVTSLSVSYNWTGYCMNHGSNQTIFRYTNYNNTEVFTLLVRSTPTVCLDIAVCSVVDSVGNTGEAIWRITNVTGAGFWGTSQPISNNSALIADSAGQIGKVYCHSASQQPHIGRWVSQAGNDITFTSTDAFDIGLHSGDFPSYTTLTLSNGFVLMAADQGVYSCQIPDENGTQSTLHIGIYSNGYGGYLHITTVQRVPLPSLVVNCSTTGLPPTSIVWTKGATQLVNSETHQLTQLLSDRSTSTYSNLLTINQTLQEATGFYSCTADNEQTGTIQLGTGPNVTTVKHYFAMYTVGDNISITCTFNGTSRIEWLRNGTLVLNGTGSQLMLQLMNTDSIHHNLYTCRGYNNSSVFGESNVTTIVIVPNTAVRISTSAVNTPTLGQNHSVHCVVSETVRGLSARPDLLWLNHDDIELIAGSQIILDGPSYQPTLATLTLTFNTLHTSHAGRYICWASLSSPALSSPLVKTEDYNILIQIPTPTVTVFPATGTTPYADSRFTLHCMMQLNQVIDSPVTFSVSWRKSGVLISNTSRITLHDVAQSGSHTYLSKIVFFTLSMTLDSGQYSCEVSLSASPPSPYLTGSPAATSTSYPLMVIRPTIEFQFNQLMYTVSEAAGSLSVCIQLVGGNLSQQVNVTIESQDGTATAPSDYRIVAVTLMFPSGSSSTSNPPEQCTTIVITNDHTPEDQDSYFNLLASSSDPSVFFTPGRKNVSVLIQDDDTHCTKFFQLLLGEVNDCTEWRFENTEEKLADINNSIISAVNARCRQCSSTANYISTGHFLCTMDPQMVLYRAELSGHPNCSKVLSYIEQWVREGHTSILVQRNSIAVKANCPIEVESLIIQAECSRLTTTATTTTITASTTPTGALNDNGEGFGVIGPVAGGIGGVIVVVGVLILGAVLVYMCARLKKQRAIHMDSNQANAIPDRRSSCYNNETYETYQMIPNSHPPISPPLPSHTGNLGVPLMFRSDSNTSYVKMIAAPVVKQQEKRCDKFYENVVPKEEAVYELMEVGPFP